MPRRRVYIPPGIIPWPSTDEEEDSEPKKPKIHGTILFLELPICLLIRKFDETFLK